MAELKTIVGKTMESYSAALAALDYKRAMDILESGKAQLRELNSNEATDLIKTLDELIEDTRNWEEHAARAKPRL